MDRKSINRAASEILSARLHRRPWRSVLRRAVPAAILLGFGIGALGWPRLAKGASESIQLESRVSPAVAGGPPTWAVRAEPPAGVATPGGVVREEAEFEGAE